MNVGDIKEFVDSLGRLFATRQGSSQKDMQEFSSALTPFMDMSLTDFTTFLSLCKTYKETGKVPEKLTKSKSSAKKSAKAPLLKKNDTEAIQQSVDELERLYSHAADPDLTYAEIESTVKEIHDRFDKNGFKAVAQGFNLSSDLSSKTKCLERILHKIKERKARNERGEVIANAARSENSRALDCNNADETIGDVVPVD